MRKYRVTFKNTYEVEANSITEAEEIACKEMGQDGTGSLAISVSEVKQKVVVEEEVD